MPLDVNEFANKIKAKYPEYKDVDNNLLAEKMIEKYPEYKGKVSFDPPKKKVATALPSEQPKESSLSATQKTVEQKPSVSSGSEDNIFSGYPGKEDKKYKLQNGMWYEYSSTIPKPGGKNIDLYEKPITDAKRVESLNKVFKQDASTAKFKTFTGYPNQEGAQYRVVNGVWEKKSYGKNSFTPITNDDSVKSLNTFFKQDAKKANTSDLKANYITKQIDNELVDSDEEELVPKLKNMFKGTDNDIFEFEETGIGYDALKVTNRLTGEDTVINLDNWSNDRNNEESKLLKGFIDVNLKFKDLSYNKKKIEDLQKEKQTSPWKSAIIDSQINELQKDIEADEILKRNYALSEGKYTASALYNKEAVNNVKNKYASTSAEAIKLKADKDSLDKERKEANKRLVNGDISQEEYDFIYKKSIDEKQQDIIDRAKNVQKNLVKLRKESNDVEKVVGHYVSTQEQRGNVATGLAKSFIKGVESPFITIIAQGQSDPERFKKAILNDTSPGIATDEYLSSASRNDFEKAVFSLAESIGTSVAGMGGAGSAASMYVASYGNYKDEINKNPEFKNIPEYEKMLLSAGLAAPASILEKFGVDKLMQKTPLGSKFTNWLISKSIKEIPKKASAEMLELAIAKNLKAATLRGLINIGADGAIEGVTESVEDLTENTIKSVYNSLKDREYFDTPKTTGEWLSSMTEAAKLGAIGGATAGSFTQVASISKDKMTSIDFEKMSNLIEDETLKDIFKTSLQAKVINKEITKFQASEIINNISENESIIKQIPTEIKSEDKYNAFNLLNEKAKLEKSIEGKDKALVTAQTDRINAINEELKAISINNIKTEQDAVKESTEQQQEVPTESSTVEYQGADEGQQEVGQGEGSERTAEKPSANIGDSNIPSEEEIIIPTEELDILKGEIDKKKDEGSLSINLGEKAFMGDIPGTIKIDPSNENTIVFETNEKIFELGNAENIGESDIASFGLSLFPSTGTLVTDTENAITYDNKKYKVLGRRRDKKGKAVVRLKDLDSGLERRIVGADAENILKDYSLSKKKVEEKINLTTEGKPEIQKKKEKKSIDNPVNVDSTLEEIKNEEERLKVEAANFENELLKDISSESKKESNLIFKIKDSEYSVTLKGDGSFSVSQKNSNGKFVGIKDLDKRKSAINEYNKIKESKDTQRLKQAEELSSMFKKEQDDKIMKLLDKAIQATSSKGRAFDATLGIPMFVANSSLKLIKASYKAGKSLSEAIKDGYDFITKNGYKVSDYDYKKFVYENINAPKDEDTNIKQKKDVTPPSAKKILGIKGTKVTVDEYQALRDQIRLEARAAKDVKKKQADMISAINTSSKTGKISAAKAKALINKIQKVKLESDKSVNEFLNYVERIFKDAEYGDKLSKSQSLRAKIRKGIKREGVQAQVVGTLKAFSKIDPKKVENIDEYKAYAEQLTEASKTTRVSKDGKPDFKVPAFLADINKYAASEMQRQNDLDKQELLDKYDDLVENKSISGDMSLKDIQKYVATLETKDEQIDSQKEANTRDYTQKEFDRLTEIINEELSNEESDISVVDKKRLRDILKIDLNKLSTKDAFQVVEHLDNFITNGITSNLDNIQATYDGQINAENLEKSGLKSYAIKLLFSPKIGKFFGKQTMSLPTFLDNIFGGEKRSLAFSKAMGLTNFMNSKSQAIVRYRNKMAQHKAQFEKKRPNGKDFNASDNIQERGVFAYLLRNSLEGDTSMFKDRVSNTLITIDKLLNSKDKNEIKKGEILNTVADKLGLRDENVTIESVTANVDPINQQDVDWWVNTWGEIYDELADVSLAVYNIELSPDAFYTTDTVSDTDRVDSFLSDENLSGLRRNLTTQPDDKRTGVLREHNRHKVTAKGSTMINFNFDANQDRAFKAALVDLHTAKDIRQIKSFLKSESFKNIMDSKEDAELLALKVTNSIKRSKGKSLEESDQIAKDAERLSNRSAVLGTSMVLGRPSQWLLQTIPVLGNTLINTGDLNIRNMFDRAAAEFIANSGRGIALRGKESLSMIESAEKYLDKNPDSMLGKSMETFDNLNNWWLETFLVNADTFTANASWLAYYEQSLRKQGVHPGGKIDWKKHEQNEEAADYAQHKLDRQQNISDPDFGGELFTSKESYKRMIVKTVMPFSNFIMNQKSRMYADLKAVRKGDINEKLSATRSLAGLAVESVVYRAMAGSIGYWLWVLANGEASDEEKEKKKKRSMNNAVSSVVTDVFALAPAMNSTTIKAFNALTAFGQDYLHNDEMDKLVLDENKKREEDRKPKMGTAEEEEFRRLALEEMIFQVDEYEAKDSGLGVFGIAYEKGGNLVDLVKKRAFGKYMDENPLTKVKSTKYLVEKDQKDMSLALTLQALHTLRLLPQELSQVSGYLDREISKNALSPKQFDKYNEMKKVMKIDTDKQYVMDIVKSTAKLQNSIQELKYIEENGGFTDKEYKEFLILKKEYGRSALGLIDNIKSGKTAKQIMGK